MVPGYPGSVGSVPPSSWTSSSTCPVQALWDLYWETLPEAGNPRELRRMYRTPAAGNLRAKTGTIKRVSALSGLVRSANGERILFSILANNVPSIGRAKRVEDRIGVRLASFERPFTTSAPDRVEPQLAMPRPVTPPTHTVRSGENLSVIARRYGVTLGALTVANPQVSPRRLMPGIELLLPTAALADAQTHRVRAGDNFSTIARTYGVSLRGLTSANPDLDPRRLQIGQRLRIPTGAG